MRLQRVAIRFRNMDPERGRQKETTRIRDEMLSADTENQLERHDTQ